MSSAALKLQPLELCFIVSQHTCASVAVTYGDHIIDLGAQPYHHCLVMLARRRVADAACGLRSRDQGWLTRDALCIVLDLEPSELNILLFRARHQWKTELPNWGELIERRGDALRLASIPFEIRRGRVTEVRYSFASLSA